MATLLELLPSIGRPILAFTSGRNTYYSFLMRPLLFGPAMVRLRWHLEDHSPRLVFGEAVWKTHLVSIPDADTYDVEIPPDCNYTRAEILDFCTNPGRDRHTYRNIDFTNGTDRAILFVYRDTTDPADTGTGYAHLTNVVIRWG